MVPINKLQCCGSGMVIHHGSRFSDPGFNNSTKMAGGKFFFCSTISTIFCNQKKHSIANDFFLKQVKKFFLSKNTIKNFSLSYQKYGVGIRDPGSGIQKKPIPESGSRVQKSPDPGSESATLINCKLYSSNFALKNCPILF